ncbi:hypothetical protein D3C74_250790 [compost metagenome]
MLHAWNIPWATGHNAAKYDIRTVVIFLQQDAPYRLNQRIDRHLILLRHLFDLGNQLWLEFAIQIFSNIFPGVHRFRLCFLLWKRNLLLVVRQIPTPVLQSCLMVLTFQPFNKSTERRNRLQYGLMTRAQCQIAAEYLLCHKGQAPAIHQNVMEAPNKVVRFIPGLQDRNTNECILCKIESFRFILDDKSFNTSFSFLFF